MAQPNSPNFEYRVRDYPQQIIICPKCKSHAIWEMQPNFFRCSGCGWRSLGTGDLSYEDVQAQEFIRVDIVNLRIKEILTHCLGEDFEVVQDFSKLLEEKSFKRGIK